jgi:hypothetical protein
MVAIKHKLDVLERNVEVLIRQELTAAARSANFARIAREELKRGQEQNRAALGRVPPHESFVDGRKTEHLESVRPDNGVIVFEFELIEDVLNYIGEMLIRHSPVLTGRFRESFAMFADEKVIEPGQPVPADVQEISFVNLQPYARKIEYGQSAQAPDGVMQVVAQMAQRRFGNIARVRFAYRTPLFGAINEWAMRTRRPSPGRRGKQRAEWLRRQPAIVVHPR